jgi:shikimate kinase
MVLSRLQLTERNLILTGYIEPNKPRIGRQLAEQLHLPFVDVEQRLEERIANIGSDFVRDDLSERHLKAIEAAVMDEMILHRNTVIRVNGSTLMHSEHYERIQTTGAVICLVARLDAILQRMHLTLGARYHDPKERGIELGLLRREWAVRKKPNIYELDVTYLDEAAMIQAIIKLWKQVSIERT